MADPIRVLHFADVHIGMENYGKTSTASGLNTRVEDFVHRLDDMVAYARQNEVDLTIFAGDAFKTRTPNPTFQREFAYRIQELAELAPVVLLVGNHDITPNAVKASSIEIYETLRVPNVIVAYDYAVQTIATRRGEVVVASAPYPIKSRLLEDHTTGGLTIAQSDALLQRVLIENLEHLAEEAAAQAGPETPRLLTAHITVSGAVWGSERSVMLGRDVQVPLSALADARWDYVALGHIHKFQDLADGRDDAPPVVYSGSLERIDFGEERDEKGFCWVELMRGATRYAFVPVAARPMRTVRVKALRDANPTQTVLARLRQEDLEGAVVRLMVQLSPENEHALDEGALYHALKQAQVFHVASLRKEVERPARMRLGDTPEGLSTAQLLERYLIAREVPAERRAQLLELADELFKTPE